MSEPCEDCGATDAEWVTCPFAFDIYGEESWHWLCHDCEYERAMDI